MVEPNASGPGTVQPEPAQARWFRALGHKIKDEYDRLHAEALEDPQRAGHGGETTWVTVLNEWLPPGYTVATRRYIVPEVGTEKFETDIVVLRPSYPEPLRSHAEILAGGVAAAFSVKLTIDASGIRDGVERAVKLRRALKPRYGNPREEITGPFPVGILAHSHGWKAPSSTPAENVNEQLRSLDYELAGHPRESLDYMCIADLGTWSCMRTPYLPPHVIQHLNPSVTARQRQEGVACTGIYRLYAGDAFTAVASFIANLLVRLSYTDPTLAPLADNLRMTGTVGGGGGLGRLWDLNDIYDDSVRAALPRRGMQDSDDDWASVLF